MINGEGTREASSKVASSDPSYDFPPFQLQISDSGGNGGGDGSPASSRYSSCGESEFERYCSANSVMGTPSMCSSSFRTFDDCIDSEFGSVRSFGIGEDISNLENFSLEKGFDQNSETQNLSSLGGSGALGDRRIQNWEGKTKSKQKYDLVVGERLVKNGSNLYDNTEDYSMLEATNAASTSSDMKMNMSGLLGYGNLSTVSDEGFCGDDDDDDLEGCISNRGRNESGLLLSSAENLPSGESFNAENGDENMSNSRFGNSPDCLLGNVEGSQSRRSTEEADVCNDGLHSESALEFEGRGMGRQSVEEETLSRYEHSEDEDSMFDYGTDNEHTIDSRIKQNIQYRGEEKTEGEISFLMNSSIAFGSEDWDDFMQETGPSTLASAMMSNTFEGRKQVNIESERSLPKSFPAIPIEVSNDGGSEQEDVKDISVANDHFQVADKSADCLESCSVTLSVVPDLSEPEQGKEVRDVPLARNQVRGNNESAVSQACSVSSMFETQPDLRVQKDPLSTDFSVMDSGTETKHQYKATEKVIGLDDNQVLKSQDVTTSQLCLPSREEPIDKEATFFEDQKPDSLLSMFENNIKKISRDTSFTEDLFEDRPASIKIDHPDLIESYYDVVDEMEEILLNSVDSAGVRFTQGNRIFQSHPTLPPRDGGSTASTSGTDDAYPPVQRPQRIDGVEVVGAKQKNGDVSFGERLVGVKEYTVYIIRVWAGKNHWEVERRYRDFVTLFRRLESVFADHGLVLPSPWFSVERESRKIFGNASPDVVAERSALIQECLRSILHSRISSTPPSALIWFLSPQDIFPSSPASNTLSSQSIFSTRGANMEDVSTLGKTISLMVEIRGYKSTRQLLEAQNYACAGCHRNFDDGKTLVRDFVQSLGWGKPRLCEYTGQLFCSSCHTNETAILPARVLHHWDYTQYPVSQLAKSYLDSIHDQPMLCVSAVNPFLFSKVPALLHVTNVRKKIGAMLPYVRCPFRRSINKALGSRRYLLENNDFFALRDLIDLSKGAFAALPVMVETVSRKILEHITDQCLICCDVGIPCGARQACNDPSFLIFPFQEGEVEKCKSCGSVFHQPCFRKLTDCPCGAHIRAELAGERKKRLSITPSEEEAALDLTGRKLGSGLSVGFLSSLFSKSKQENRSGRKDSETVILMGSLPSTSL